MPDTPRTATGRKVVAMHGSALLDDVLGIEHEAAHLDALTAAVEGIEPTDDQCAKHFGNYTYTCSCKVEKAAVLAILTDTDTDLALDPDAFEAYMGEPAHPRPDQVYDMRELVEEPHDA